MQFSIQIYTCKFIGHRCCASQLSKLKDETSTAVSIGLLFPLSFPQLWKSRVLSGGADDGQSSQSLVLWAVRWGRYPPGCPSSSMGANCGINVSSVNGAPLCNTERHRHTLNVIGNIGSWKEMSLHRVVMCFLFRCHAVIAWAAI